MAKMMQLKEDPELKPIFDDIEANGAAAMEKYWNDTELMSKISQKMSSMNLGPATPPRKQDKLKVTHHPHKLPTYGRLPDLGWRKMCGLWDLSTIH